MNIKIPRRAKPCDHIHYSGRRCAQLIKIGTQVCPLHRGLKCAECTAMLDAFPNRKTLEGTDGSL